MDKSNLPDACFNSTLVQLKAVPVFPSCRWFPSFNSTLVQLKDNEFNASEALKNRFQFYLSSIKSRNLIIGWLKDWRFNSTLVQLKASPI